MSYLAGPVPPLGRPPPCHLVDLCSRPRRAYRPHRAGRHERRTLHGHPETSPAEGPTGDERGVALGRGTNPLPVKVGDMLDLWSVGDLTARGRLVAAGALGSGDLLTALVPD